MRAVRALAPLLPILAVSARGGEIPSATVVFEAYEAALPTHVAEAAPPRFVLLEDGQVFVGGSSGVSSGRLDRDALKTLDKRLGEVRKLSGLGGKVTLGSGDRRYRLLLRKGRPIDMQIVGDPAQAPPALRPLAALLTDLGRFDDPSLQPYQPASLLMNAKESPLPGGCRRWPLPDPPASATFVPRIVPADQLASWPTGATPAFVCAGDKTFVVTLRPLLPGEKP